MRSRGSEDPVRCSPAVIFALLGLTASHAAAGNPTAADCKAAASASTKAAAAHKLREAHDQASVCAAASCSAQTRAACKRRVANLTKAIPTIVFAVTDSSGHDLTDVKVTMDGESLTDHLDGTALSVDPGQHTFAFESAGQPSLEQSFLIVEGQKNRRESLAFPAPPPPPPPPVAAVAEKPAEASTGRRPLRTLGLVIGGVGVTGLVVGGVTGGIALAKSNASQNDCASASNCPNHAAAVSDHSAAQTLSTVSTITFIVGGAALAGGVSLYLLAPRERVSGGEGGSQGVSLRLDPILGPAGGGLKLEGAFQ
jgi:hypothetical protein